jgi:hypothetical protein
MLVQNSQKWVSRPLEREPGERVPLVQHDIERGKRPLRALNVVGGHLTTAGLLCEDTAVHPRRRAIAMGRGGRHHAPVEGHRRGRPSQS